MSFDVSCLLKAILSLLARHGVSSTQEIIQESQLPEELLDHCSSTNAACSSLYSGSISRYVASDWTNTGERLLNGNDLL